MEVEYHHTTRREKARTVITIHQDFTEEILQEMRDGMGIAETATKYRCNDRILRELWLQVRDERMKVDWRRALRNAICPAMEAAKLKRVITEQARRQPNLTPERGTSKHGAYWTRQVEHEFGISVSRCEKCDRILSSGVPQLIEHVSNGRTSVNAALKIAKLPKAEQPEAIRKLDLRRKPLEELQSYVNIVSNQKLAWEQNHGQQNGSVVRECAQAASAEDLQTLVSNLEAAASWCTAVAATLRG